jgi:molecular chaperone DnaJ
VFGRSGRNLTITVPVTFPEAALGTTMTVPTLDGKVTLKVPAGTQSGRTLRVRGRGVPGASGRNGGKAGDLLVKVDVQVPTELSEEQRAAVEALAEVTEPAPRVAVDS